MYWLNLRNTIDHALASGGSPAQCWQFRERQANTKLATRSLSIGAELDNLLTGEA